MLNIICIGGGNGLSNLLSELVKQKDFRISAIVTTMDSGGSTGKIRKEHNVIAFGDLRRALSALSENKELKKEFNFRYKTGKEKGHVSGNLFLLNLTKKLGSEKKAILEAHKILEIKGEVLPVTYDRVNIVAETKKGKKIVGEDKIDTAKSFLDIKNIYLSPLAKLNPSIKKVIQKADVILIGPGDLYTSVLCNFLVSGLRDEVRKSKAKKIWINNLTNKLSETNGFQLKDYLNEIDKYLGLDIIDYVIYQNKPVGDKSVTGVKGVRGGKMMEGRIQFIGDDFATRKNKELVHNVKKIIKTINQIIK